jgi:hypothetical protein
VAGEGGGVERVDSGSNRRLRFENQFRKRRLIDDERACNGLGRPAAIKLDPARKIARLDDFSVELGIVWCQLSVLQARPETRVVQNGDGDGTRVDYPRPHAALALLASGSLGELVEAARLLL